jgi:hypothetical protein
MVELNAFPFAGTLIEPISAPLISSKPVLSSFQRPPLLDGDGWGN